MHTFQCIQPNNISGFLFVSLPSTCIHFPFVYSLFSHFPLIFVSASSTMNTTVPYFECVPLLKTTIHKFICGNVLLTVPHSLEILISHLVVATTTMLTLMYIWRIFDTYNYNSSTINNIGENVETSKIHTQYTRMEVYHTSDAIALPPTTF